MAFSGELEYFLSLALEIAMKAQFGCARSHFSSDDRLLFLEAYNWWGGPALPPTVAFREYKSTRICLGILIPFLIQYSQIHNT